jgi:hypothetical protein
MLKMSMAGPLGMLVTGPAATTNDVEDVDDRPLWVLSRFPAAATTRVEDVDGGPPCVHGDMK